MKKPIEQTAYPNLEKGIFGRGITKKAIARGLEISPRSLYNKLSGKVEFTWREICLIQSQFFPDYDKDFLFFSNNNNQKAG